MELKIVNKDLAIQLKELDFNWDCDHCYEHGYLIYFGDVVIPNELITLAPAQALVIKWLRDVYSIYITTYPIQENMFSYEIAANDIKELDWVENYTTYELAEEAGILKGIEILKTRQL